MTVRLALKWKMSHEMLSLQEGGLHEFIMHMNVALSASALFVVICDICGDIVMKSVCYRYPRTWIQDRAQHHGRTRTKSNIQHTAS
jgi:hypothetical protein